MKCNKWLIISMLSLSMLGCKKPAPQTHEHPETAPAEQVAAPEDKAMNNKDAGIDLTRLNRQEFNRAALYLNVPLFWKYGEETLTPQSLVTLDFYPRSKSLNWRSDAGFSGEFYALYEKMVQAYRNKPEPNPNDAEATRRAKVLEELDQVGSVVLHTDFSQSSQAERDFVAKMLEIGSLIDALYARQVGLSAIVGKIAADDTASQSMLRRNWKAGAESPKMKADVACSAVSGMNAAIVDVYPADLQKDPEFCTAIGAQKDAEALFYQFAAVQKAEDGSLVAVPYTERYKSEMTAISTALNQAAEILDKSSTEPALAKYLKAAAQSYLDNNWEPADEAWAAMNAKNSTWYVRVAPDETYWEPCSRKAGFHMTFARINPEALQWQEKLTPVRQEMEDAMAKIAGEPYKSRTVSFQLPDFIDIVANFGDDRDAFGATIGQSLPNWGAVANEGRGRTVAMSNLYTDPESLKDRTRLASSLFTQDGVKFMEGGAGPGLLGTIIHEAAHNLGPAHEYKVNNKVDDEIFGGALATLAEELKAQTSALWYLAFLQSKGIIDADMQNKSYVDSVYWAFGHIARGMTTPDGKIQPYSQLSAIHIGMLMEAGALKFEPETMAANGTDRGVFVFDLDKFPAAAETIMREIATIKATGNKDALVALQLKHITSKEIPFALITERMLRLPKTSFVYSIQL